MQERNRLLRHFVDRAIAEYDGERQRYVIPVTDFSLQIPGQDSKYIHPDLLAAVRVLEQSAFFEAKRKTDRSFTLLLTEDSLSLYTHKARGEKNHIPQQPVWRRRFDPADTERFERELGYGIQNLRIIGVQFNSPEKTREALAVLLNAWNTKSGWTADNAPAQPAKKPAPAHVLH